MVFPIRRFPISTASQERLAAARSAPGGKRVVIAPFTHGEENIGQLERKANPQRSAGELTFEKVQTLVQCIKAFGAPYTLFILTGGDPAKRSDI